jgi:hypothetical protein
MTDARLTTRIVATGEVVATKTLRDHSPAGVLERAASFTEAVARQRGLDPDDLTTEVTSLPARPTGPVFDLAWRP